MSRLLPALLLLAACATPTPPAKEGTPSPDLAPSGQLRLYGLGRGPSEEAAVAAAAEDCRDAVKRFMQDSLQPDPTEERLRVSERAYLQRAIKGYASKHEPTPLDAFSEGGRWEALCQVELRPLGESFSSLVPSTVRKLKLNMQQTIKRRLAPSESGSN